MKVYLDTCILSALIDERISIETIEALGKIADTDMVILVTAEKTLEEFMNFKSNNRKRLALKILYRLMSKVPNENIIKYIPAILGTCTMGSSIMGGHHGRTDSLFSRLCDIFDKSDAEHIFQAIKAECDYFLTLDIRTIIKRARNRESEMKLLSPRMTIGSPTDYVRLTVARDNQGLTDA